LCDFLLLIRADESDGRARPLSQYLAMFPGQEVEIAREFLAHLDGTLPSGSFEREEPGDLERYELGRVIGQGGMGEVVLAHDLRLDRELAVKLLRRPGARARRRFLREVHITGSLDHPGIVPVHDLGEDAAGSPFFAMKHVEGIDLEELIERVRRNEPQWTLARALEVLIKVCDTMAFAHSRGVVHRDLKPSNVRVGRFGEVYVMDWGLARVLTEAMGEERSDPGPDVELGADPSALTVDGDVLGTPAYMAPEQAEGRNESVGKAADVYAVGTLLYQLLSGRRPYGSDERPLSSREVLELVRTTAPASLHVLEPRAPRELVAICEKAMQREPSQRYAEMEAVGRDLRAFLDRRLVSAYDTGAIERALKWTRRNRSIVVPVIVVVVVAVIAAVLVRQGRAEGRHRLLQLSRNQLAADFDTLWPPSPANEAALEHWLEQADEVLSTRAQDLAVLEELKHTALPLDPDAPAERAERTRLALDVRRRRSLILYFAHLAEQVERGEHQPPEGKTLAWIREQVTANQKRVESELRDEPEHLTFRFEDEEDQVLFDALTLLASEQEKILGTDRPFGLIDLARWGLTASRRVEELSLVRERTAWALACRSIASRDECPFYAGLELSPQVGLVPIGRDPRSGLWEFAHVLSGEVPTRAADGSLRIDERSAIVLVLIPGGTLQRGAQHEDSSAPNFDPWSESSTVDEVELLPFFLSKYELTQAQWQRVSGRNPSFRAPGDPLYGVTLLNPVESVAFDDARRFLLALGLRLPTEAQWEWGARGGTHTPWSSGPTAESVVGHANIADRTAPLPELDDGAEIHAGIGSFQPNPFGLHDTMGNVREWSRDVGPFDYRSSQTQIETGERLYEDDGTRAVRGGSFALSVLSCRSAARDRVGPLFHATDLGLRPARDIDR
jgi:formylglycine-generating enzyme required for sulfatase activity